MVRKSCDSDDQPAASRVFISYVVRGWRTPWGYETEKALAAIDYFARQSPKPIGIWGYGEGGAIATFACSTRRAHPGGRHFGVLSVPREKLATQPLYRNTFGLLSDFGDAELLAMAKVKTIIVDRNPGPVWDGPSTADPKRRGAAPMKLIALFRRSEIEAEFQRLQRLRPSANCSSRDGCATPLSCRLFPFRSAMPRRSGFRFASAEDANTASSKSLRRSRRHWFGNHGLCVRRSGLRPNI